MKTTYKRIVSLFLSFVFILSNMVTIFDSTVFAQDTELIKMDIISRDKDQNGNNIYHYASGREISAQADFLISGTSVSYPEGKLIVSVPKVTASGIEIVKPNFVSSSEAISSILTETDTHYVMTYTFVEIKGGGIGTYDFPFKFPNFITPNGDTITPTWELQNKDGEVIKKVERTFTAIAYSKWKSDKRIPDNSTGILDDPVLGDARAENPGEGTGYQEFRRNIYDSQLPKFTTEDGKNYVVRYELDAFFVPESGADFQNGIYNAKTITFVDTIPEGGTFVSIDLDNKDTSERRARVVSREYDEATRQVKMVVELLNNGLSSHSTAFGSRSGLKALIRIAYKNQPIDKIHQNKFHIIVDEGLNSEQITPDTNWNIKFKWNKLTTTTPSGGRNNNGVTLSNTYRNWTFTYNPETGEYFTPGRKEETARKQDYNVLGLPWYTEVINSNENFHNDGGAGYGVGRVSELFSIKISGQDFNPIDNRLYFNNFKMDKWDVSLEQQQRFNSTPNILYGIKRDGTKVEIARNITFETPMININDVNQEFGQLELAFIDKPLVLDNSKIGMYTYLKPTETEIQKFDNFEYTNTQTYYLSNQIDHRVANINTFEVLKNPDGTWTLPSNAPVGTQIDSNTGEITIPTESLYTGSGVRVFSLNGNIHSFVVDQRSDLSSVSQPVIVNNSDLSVDVLPSKDSRATKLIINATFNLEGRVEIVAEKNENGEWNFTSEIPQGVTIDSVSGKIHFSSDAIAQNSDLRALHENGIANHTRTPYIDDKGVSIIRPATVATLYNDESKTISLTPYDNGLITKYNVSYIPGVISGNINKDVRETHYDNNNRNFINFQWMRARIENGTDKTVVFSTEPGKNNVELFTRGLIGGTWVTENYTANMKSITLLPAGVNFVKHNGIINQLNASNNTNPPEVIENFRGTGRTAVIYSYDLTKQYNVDDTTHLNGAYSAHKFIVDVTKYANDGDNIVDHYLVWDNPVSMKPNHAEYIDLLDLNGNGDRTEKFIHTTNRIRLILPAEVSARKNISIDKVNWLLNSPAQDIGSDIYYKLNVKNNSIRDLDNFKLLDVFPALGDHKIVSNQAGEYLQRGTQFVTPLTRALEDVPENGKYLDKWTFLYSVTPQGADLQSVTTAPWLTKEDITDWSKVTSIMVQLKDGQKFNSKEELSIVVYSQIPYDKTIAYDIINDIGSKSVNSFAIATLGDSFAEANEVVATNIRYEVNGVIFFDYNKNGQWDENVRMVDENQNERFGPEKRLAGYTVTLVNPDGTEYKDPEGNTISAVTDAEGKYTMKVYQRGDYYIRVSKSNADEKFSQVYTVESKNEFGATINIPKPGTILEVDGVIGNDASDIVNEQGEIDPNFGKTPIFGLYPATRFATRNAGIIITRGDIEIVKTNEEGELLQGVVFGLFTHNQDNNEDIEVARSTTDENGYIKFEQIPFGIYKVKEISTLDKYVIDENSNEVFLSEDILLVKLDFVNRIKKSEVTVKKVDAEDASKVLEGVKFVLKQEGEVKYEATTDANGIANFEEVVYGDYVLEEEETSQGYILSEETREVSIKEDGEVVDLGEFKNKAIPKPEIPKAEKPKPEIPNIEKPKPNLPKTGASMISGTSILSGFALIILGMYFVTKKRVKESN